MFSLTSSHRFFLYSQPTDMRKSFDGLCGLVRSEMGRNPVSDDVFLFLGTRKDALKLLHWDVSAEGGERGFRTLLQALGKRNFLLSNNRPGEQYLPTLLDPPDTARRGHNHIET